MDMYCLKCRKKSLPVDIRLEEALIPRTSVIKAKCLTCGTAMFKMGGAIEEYLHCPTFDGLDEINALLKQGHTLSEASDILDNKRKLQSLLETKLQKTT